MAEIIVSKIVLSHLYMASKGTYDYTHTYTAHPLSPFSIALILAFPKIGVYILIADTRDWPCSIFPYKK